MCMNSVYGAGGVRRSHCSLSSLSVAKLAGKSQGVLGALPLGEGVADKATKRRESSLLAGAIRGAT